jgi:SAM-dependent methyltransferase
MIDEPLQDSAALALAWSRQECDQGSDDHPGCAWYHGSWQMLRYLGVFHSILSDDDFFLPTLTRLIESGTRRILISGAADYALLARIAAAAGPQLADMQVTVVDLCGTPLRLNAWYGERYGINVKVVRENVLLYQPAEAFDLICTHSFLCFFDAAERRRLVESWRHNLRPGGVVLTAQRARTEDRQAIIRYSQTEVDALAERTQRRAEALFRSHAVDPRLARQLAVNYGRFHWTYLIRSAQEIRSLFEDCGFELETFAPPGQGQPVADAPGTPNESGSVRWRILARKPED